MDCSWRFGVGGSYPGAESPAFRPVCPEAVVGVEPLCACTDDARVVVMLLVIKVLCLDVMGSAPGYPPVLLSFVPQGAVWVGYGYLRLLFFIFLVFAGLCPSATGGVAR